MDRHFREVTALTIIVTAMSIMTASYGYANQAGKASEMMDKPSDPERAVAAEYQQLKARNTVEAFELFIERHPDHPLADDARRNLKRLRGG